MKLITKSTLEFKIIIALLVLNVILTTETVLKKNDMEQEKCENSCQVCQKAAYQLKFQGIADCDQNGVCKNTCFKIREMWSAPWSPFEPFVKDVFGKCEICFRSGHCTISQCKDQEREELEIINSIVNASHLTAKVNADLLVAFPDGTAKINNPNIQKSEKVNNQIEKILNKDIQTSIAIGSTDILLPKVQNLIHNYISTQNFNGKIYEILGTNIALQPGVAVSSSNISFWNPDGINTKSYVSPVIQKHVENAVKKLTKTTEQINLLKQQHLKKGQAKALDKLNNKTNNQKNQIANKINNIMKKLDVKEQRINRIIKNSKTNESAQQGLKQTLNVIQANRQVVSNARQHLKGSIEKLPRKA